MNGPLCEWLTLSPEDQVMTLVEDPSFVEYIRDAVETFDKTEVALRNWSEAYPEDVFLPLTDEQQKAVVALLLEHGYTPDAVYAHWGRHIVKCLREEMGQ